MKNILKIFAVLTVVFSFTLTSCDDDLLDVNFNTTVKATIVAHIDQGQENINESVVLSLDNSDTNSYLNNLSDVRIKKLTYKIISFMGDPEGSLNGILMADNIVLGADNFNVKNAYDAVTIFEITDVNALSSMASSLRNNQGVTISLTGDSVSVNDPMDFDIEVTAELEITANPL